MIYVTLIFVPYISLFSDTLALLHLAVAASGILAPRLVMSIRKRFYETTSIGSKVSDISSSWAVAAPVNQENSIVRAYCLFLSGYWEFPTGFLRTSDLKIAFFIE